MSAEVHSELAALIEQALPPEQQAALEQRIQLEPEICAEWAAMLRQDVLLGELFSEERFMQSRYAVKPLAHGMSKRIVLGICAAAACVALSLFGFLASRATPKHPAETLLSVATGDVQIIRTGSNVAAQIGAILQPGDSLQIAGAGARAEVRFADGSQISAEQGTRWKWASSQDGRQELYLETGALSALIEKQKNGGAFVFNTAQARVTVIGTRFHLAVANEISTLELFEGRVKFRRNVDAEEIDIQGGQRAIAESKASQPLAALPLNPPSALPQPVQKYKALLVTAEPLPFFAHDVALQHALMALGFDVELTTFDRVSAANAASKDLIVIPSHKCNHSKVLSGIQTPIIAWHNAWHQDLGLLSYDSAPEDRLRIRSVEWAAQVAEPFAELVTKTQKQFELNVYASVPETRGGVSVLKLKEQSPLTLFPMAVGFAGPRVAFSIDIREGAGTGAPVEIGEALFSAAVRWCLKEQNAGKQ